MNSEVCLRLCPSCPQVCPFSRQAQAAGTGNTYVPLYTRPCDAPGWAEREAAHATQRPAMMRYMALRAGLVALQEDAQAEQYEKLELLHP